MIRKGTLVFPRTDRDFLQQLEMAANNGAVDDVETMYVLTGSTYYVPEDLVACDDPRLYIKAEKDKVRAREYQLVERVAAFYEGVDQPRMVLWVHTHPDGNTSASNSDKNWCSRAKRRVDQQFEEDYEFFLGIHGLGEACDPDPEWMRRPEQTDENEISWWGENRKHTLAVYDGQFEPAPVMVTTAAELQQQQRQQRTRRPPDPGLGPGPGGEIWD